MAMTEGDLAYEWGLYHASLERAKNVGLTSLEIDGAIDAIEKLQADYLALRREYDLLKLGYTKPDEPPNIGNSWHFGKN